MTYTADIDNYADVLDVRDIIQRVEDLEETSSGDEMFEEDQQEFDTLNALLDDLRGSGGDHQWKGDWYPVTLIRDSYFIDYAQELAEDIGAVNPDLGWPYSCIDWKHAASELRMDYASVDFNGVTYWYR